MQASPTLTTNPAETARYARTIEASKRVRWDIDRDVIRGRAFDLGHVFLPDGLSLADELPFLKAAQRRFWSQVQGRTYARMFALVERTIGAKMLDVSRGHALGDQVAFEALVRLTDEELKHQELFRRIEALAAAGMPAGYRFDIDANAVAAFVLGRCDWAVLALTCHIELFSQAHYRASIGAEVERAAELSPLFKDVFLFHWREESQHAVLDELEWIRADRRLADDAERDAAVGDLIALVGGVDGIVQTQAAADAAYFLAQTGIDDAARADAVRATMLKAYRWQYIVSGALHPQFRTLLGSFVSEAQLQRIQQALAPLAYAVPCRAEAAIAMTH
ncbi:MAG TPA: hypothetical protein VFR90_05115 [Methylibium sp.]|uniref:hypothetical protein n=1 Tax=Methylibium sp. TaxID=2067992 RepID=UPI002DB9DD0A|nr:hypothetical protein [Methylibium sp.]HEU4458482.1 hypothetical protein [Methylibium sp.]